MSIILHNNYNKKKVLVPKFQDQLWILNRLIMVNYMYYFPPNTKPLTNTRAYLVPKVIYSTLSKVMLSVISLINMSFYVTSTNVIFFFLPSSTIFCSLNLYQLIFFLLVHQLLSFEHDQTILNDSLSSFHQQRLPLSLSEFPHFESDLSNNLYQINSQKSD